MIELACLRERLGIVNPLYGVEQCRLIRLDLADHLTALLGGDVKGFFWQCNASKV
jgi:hypothetical protein